MPRPNILIFMPDQQRADCVGCFGNPLVRTPNIDALAARGVRFDSAWVNHPVCSPSRVNLMTGWYPHTRGHRTLTHLVQPHEPNLLKYLKQGGYHVAWAGARGDVFAEGVTEDSTHFCGWTTSPSQRGMGPQYEEQSPLYNAFYHGKRPGDDTWIDFDEATTLTALDWLQEKPAGPWCLWMPLIFPHLPFEVEEPWYSMYSPTDLVRRIPGHGAGKPAFHEEIRAKLGTDRVSEEEWQEIIRVYYGMVSRVDDQLGRVMAMLDRIGELENTLVIYLTDHGEYIGDFGLVEKWPSGMDRSLLQNPVIMAGPGISEGAVAGGFTEMVDILPTILQFADIDVTHTHFGRSLVPMLEDPATVVRDCAYSEGGFRLGDVDLLEVAAGEYRNKADLQHEMPWITGKCVSLRTESHTYVYRLYENDELYDRFQDPDETTNLIDQHAELASALKGQILDWMLETSDVIPWAPDPRFPRIQMGQHDEFHF
jgi:arylsulfatase A-like enzyme